MVRRRLGTSNLPRSANRGVYSLFEGGPLFFLPRRSSLGTAHCLWKVEEQFILGVSDFDPIHSAFPYPPADDVFCILERAIAPTLIGDFAALVVLDPEIHRVAPSLSCVNAMSGETLQRVVPPFLISTDCGR
jgi:hypothetical protein